jgi:diguanylate cyclase (GGDEF)-like protein
MENILEKIAEKQGEMDETEKVAIDTYLSYIDSDIGPDEPEELIEELTDQVELVQAYGRPKDSKRLFYLTEEGRELEEETTQQVGFFGYELATVYSCEELKRSMEKERNQLVIVNTCFIRSDELRVIELSRLKQQYEGSMNIIFVSEEDDFDIRLQTVRAGGDAFFQFPLDIGRLIDRIESLNAKKEQEPYHILIVDDDPEQVSFHALLLQQAGMITSVARDPKQVVKLLIEAKPELILMDMYMPGCSGMELAAVIRQQEAFVSIPIVFLSVEKDMDKQIAAIKRGGDDFLTKPIRPEHLIASITNRAERTRSMRYLMERDSLTGLLNHSNLKEQLNREVMRSKRTGSEICFAMIDVDHFKKVNDTYGHLTGDRVLRGLARLLQERLRATDIIGRYGGEEFAVILLNTDLENAEQIVNEIRDKFSKLTQRVNGSEFHVTFSCGIASFPDYDTTDSLNEAADNALYEAKEKGRNRTILARNR